jgi:ABC-type uncharacterized transport system involved in gliding motility auxiliary subunit
MTSSSPKKFPSLILWTLLGLLILTFAVVRILMPDTLWINILVGLSTVAVGGVLLYENRSIFGTRSTQFLINSVVTSLLVIGIVSVLNFIAFKYPERIDLTKNKLHTLSDQTNKAVQGLKKELKITFFSRAQQKEEFRAILDRYRALNSKVSIDYADADKEMVRLQQLQIKQLNTAYIEYGEKNAKVESPTEEKLTNAILKLSQERPSTLCAVTGHGEAAFTESAGGGLSLIQQELERQQVVLKTFEIPQTKDGKISPDCDALAIIGPKKTFTSDELNVLQRHLDGGGRALVALDVEPSGKEPNPELIALLKKWHIDVINAIVLDPRDNAVQLGPVGVVIRNFSKEHPITRDMVGMLGVFPALRPVIPTPNSPASLTLTSLAKTGDAAWAEKDFASITQGQPTRDPRADLVGSSSFAVAAEGKLDQSTAPRNTRLAVIGNSLFATNNFSRNGVNKDFLLNALSWVLEDESMISIRARDDVGGKIEMSPQALNLTLLGLFVVAPALVLIFGIAVWLRRRKL